MTAVHGLSATVSGKGRLQCNVRRQRVSSAAAYNPVICRVNPEYCSMSSRNLPPPSVFNIFSIPQSLDLPDPPGFTSVLTPFHLQHHVLVCGLSIRACNGLLTRVLY